MANDYISQVTLPDNNIYDLKDPQLKIYSGTCSTAAATAIKEVTCSSAFVLEKGVIIFVTFTYTNSAAVANLKLRVNNTTDETLAKPIKYLYNGDAPSNIPAVGYLRENQTYYFSYDGTNWVVRMSYNTNTTPYGIRVYRDTVSDSAFNNDYPLLISRSLASNIASSYSNNVYGTINNSDATKIPTYNPYTGNLKAPIFTGNLTGNADTATKLAASKTLWGQSFDGSANVTGNMTDVGPSMKLPSGKTSFEFLKSDGNAANGKFGRLGLNTTYANADLTNYVLDVLGKVRIKLPNTATNSKEFIITGSNNNYISLHTSGIQAYNSSGSVSLLYLQYYGGNLQIGSSDYSSSATRDLYGQFDFKSATGFNYSGMGAGSDDAARNIWFSYNGKRGVPVYDDDFKYNPSTNTITIGTGTLTATQYSGNAATAATISTTGGTTGKFWRGDNSWSDTVDGGTLKIKNNGITLTIGSTNTSWVHFTNDKSKSFYFGNQVTASGGFKVYDTTTTLTSSGLNISSNTDSSSTATGSIITAGGVGIAKTLYVGTGVNITGKTITNNTTAASTAKLSSQLQVMNTNGGNLAIELYRGATNSTTNGTASWQISVESGVFHIRSDYKVVSGEVTQQTTYNNDILSINHASGAATFIGDLTAGTTTIKGKLVVNPSYHTSNSYNEGIRINQASNGWANIHFGGAKDTTSGNAAEAWLVGRRGAAGTYGAVGDFTIEENGSSGLGLTLHKSQGGATLYTSKAGSSTCFKIINAGTVAATKWLNGLEILSASMAANSNATISIGQAASSKNRAYIGFHYADSGSDSNYLELGLYGVNEVFKLYGNKQIEITTTTDASSTSTGALKIAGGVGIDKKLYVGTNTYSSTYSITSSAVEKVRMEWNATDLSIDFIFV